jgi:hypothetical protein
VDTGSQRRISQLTERLSLTLPPPTDSLPARADHYLSSNSNSISSARLTVWTNRHHGESAGTAWGWDYRDGHQGTVTGVMMDETALGAGMVPRILARDLGKLWMGVWRLVSPTCSRVEREHWRFGALSSFRVGQAYPKSSSSGPSFRPPHRIFVPPTFSSPAPRPCTYLARSPRPPLRVLAASDPLDPR